MAKRNKSVLRYNEEDERTLLEDILGFVKVFVISLICVLIFVNLIAHPVNVVGRSMDPTLQDGETGFTSIISLMFDPVERGDIVVVKMEDPDTKQMSHWVKRIVGMPGETIECKDEQIYINGQVYDESSYIDDAYRQEMIDTFGFFNESFDPVTLGEDEYFALGDNRPYSRDSRDPSVGPVSKSQIFAKGILVLFPFDKIGVK